MITRTNLASLIVAGGLLSSGALTAVAWSADTKSMFDVAFGATVTTDYMSRGTTQTDHQPAAQGTVEWDVGQFYAGIFVSNVNYGFNDTEIDLSIGWRPEIE